VGTGLRAHVAGQEAVTFTPDAVIALLATAFTLVATLLMLQETIALGKDQDPVNNDVRSLVRRFPRVTYALAVVIGMLLGHLLWP
jgi:hypothetical protein